MGGQILGSAGLWAAFLLGLTGGFGHCLVMCGPFVAGASLARGSSCARGARVGRYQVAYHAGRLTTYALLGLVLGLLGEAGAVLSLEGPFSPLQFNRYLKLGAGAVTIVLGLALAWAWLRGRGARLPEPGGIFTRMKWWRSTTTRFAEKGGWYALPLGMLMGLLPCLPLLPVEVAALGSGSGFGGTLTMLAFGIGTLPALAGFGIAFELVGARSRGWIALATSLVVMALGALTLAQGVVALRG